MKLPVFKALGASLSYIGAHFFTLIKIMWLPALLLTGVMAYVMPTVMDAQMQLIAVEETGDPTDVLALLGPIFKSSGLMYLAAAIFYPMIMAGVLKHVIRGDAPRLPFYLQYGGDELRLLLAYILIFIISVVAVIAGFLGFGVLSAVLGIALGRFLPKPRGSSYSSWGLSRWSLRSGLRCVYRSFSRPPSAPAASASARPGRRPKARHLVCSFIG